jgi:phospholipid N-methyltransferase
MPGSTAATKRRARSRRRNIGVPSPWKMFLKGFFKNPVMVGSVIPTSGRTIRKVLGPVDWNSCKLFVEYGPGVGTLTRPILDRLAPDAKLIVIDTNPDFIRYLKQTIVDPRLSAVLGSATDVERIIHDHHFEHADYIVSGLPFSTLPPGIGDSIVQASRKVLREGGAFVVYLYNPAVKNFLTPHFDHIDHDMEWWNVPPAQIWWCWKH